MLSHQYMLRSAVSRSNLSQGFLLLSKSRSTASLETADVNISFKKLNKDLDRFRAEKEFKGNFIENLFLGIIQPEILEYPQIKSLEQVRYLREHCDKLKLVIDRSKHEQIESNALELKSILGPLAEHEFVGLKIKEENVGLGYYESETCYVQEFLSESPSLSRRLSNLENFGFSLIHLFGSATQKEKYLSKILNGECMICTAHTEKDFEASWLTKSPLNTVATEVEDGCYAISGHKTLVYNTKDADMIIVSARISGHPERSDYYTMFMIDKNSQGVTILEPFDKLGLEGVEICDIVLKDVKATKDDIIGVINEGDKMMRAIFSKGALSNGAQCIALMRKMVNESIMYSIENNLFRKPLYKHCYIQGKIGELTCKLYEAESMTYLMTGRADTFKNSDIFLESLIVKIFNSEALNFILHECIQLSDDVKTYDSEFFERACRDSYYYNSFDDANKYLKMHLVNTGMKYLMEQMKSPTVKGFKPKSKIQLTLMVKLGVGNIDETLAGYLNRVFVEGSFALQRCVMSLNFCAELLVNKYGKDVLNRTWELSELGKILIIIYSLCAVLGRASRSLCIGLAYTETEFLIAQSLYEDYFERVMAIQNGIFKSLERDDFKFRELGDSLLESGKYSPSEPIPRVTG